MSAFDAPVLTLILNNIPYNMSFFHQSGSVIVTITHRWRCYDYRLFLMKCSIQVLNYICNLKLWHLCCMPHSHNFFAN